MSKQLRNTSALSFNSEEGSACYEVRLPRLAQQGREWRGPCPVHRGDDDNPAVYPETGAAFCHSQCNRGWDMVGFEMARTGTDFSRAITFAIARALGIDVEANG